jgi:GcrA cell cycle regulator
MSWTDERIDTLRKMWEGGSTASQIAEELTGVSRNAVIGKAHRLGLQSRPSPVKPNEPIAGKPTAAEAAPVAAAEPIEPKAPPLPLPSRSSRLRPPPPRPPQS